VEGKNKRLLNARSELQKQGLDNCTTYMIRKKGLNFLEACYESHRAVCQYALRKGWKTILICEDDLHFIKDMSGNALGQRVQKLEEGWMRLMLGYFPLLLWGGKKQSGKKGVTFSTTAYVASLAYLEYMDATPFAMVEEQSKKSKQRSLDGPGLDAFQSVRLSKQTFVEWPSPVFVDFETGKDNDHAGSVWETGISIPTQHFLQHIFWVFPVLLCVLVASIVVIIVAVRTGATAKRVAAVSSPNYVPMGQPLQLDTLSPTITTT
jgi:hypothetical protein